jgi:hypothetical protein
MVFEVVAQPDRAHPEGRDRNALFGQFVGDPRLAPGRLIDRHRRHRCLDLRGDPVLQNRLAARQLLQRQLAAFVVEIFEPVEAVPAQAHDLAGLADVAELLGQFEQAGLGPNDLLILGHRCLLEPPWRGLRNPDHMWTAPWQALSSATSLWRLRSYVRPLRCEAEARWP